MRRRLLAWSTPKAAAAPGADDEDKLSSVSELLTALTKLRNALAVVGHNRSGDGHPSHPRGVGGIAPSGGDVIDLRELLLVRATKPESSWEAFPGLTAGATASNISANTSTDVFLKATNGFVFNNNASSTAEGGGGSLVDGLIDLLSGLAAQCSEQSEAARQAHNTCDTSTLYRVLNGYAFAPMLALCLFGNFMNVAVYRRAPQLGSLVAVRMLAIKAVLNTLFILSLVPAALHLTKMWPASSHWEFVYWTSWPYFLFFANVVGGCATWVVVLMTLERYLYVVYPVRSRQMCTYRNFVRCLAVIFVLCVALNLSFPLSRTVELPEYDPACPESRPTTYRLSIKPGRLYELHDTMFHYVSLVFVIIVPLLAMSVMTAVIFHKLVYKLRRRRTATLRRRTTMVEPPANDRQINAIAAAGLERSTSTPTFDNQTSAVAQGQKRKPATASRASGQKRCVTHVTLSTTLTHLALELPSAAVYAAAGVFGTTAMHADRRLCVCYAVANFCGLCNASVIFFIYLLFSPTYRTLFVGLFLGSSNADAAAGEVGETQPLVAKGIAVVANGRERLQTCPYNMKKPAKSICGPSVAHVEMNTNTRVGKFTNTKAFSLDTKELSTFKKSAYETVL